MNWAVGFILAIGILLPVGIGLGLGAYRMVQNPVALAEASALIAKAVFPIFAAYVKKPNAPDVEAKMHEVGRRAGEWDNFAKRERDR